MSQELTRRSFLALSGVGGALWASSAPAPGGEDWPQFRGPTGQGISTEAGLPLEWSPTKNIQWKTALPGTGWSSPAIVGNRIWLTAATGNSLRLLTLDAGTGKLLTDTEVLQVRDKGPGMHDKNSFASPTPIVSGNRVYVHFGYYGSACLDAENNRILWKQTLKYEPQHGPGGSPLLVDDLLIISCDGFDAQFVVALDAATGKIRWKTARGKGNQAYTTPLLIHPAGLPPQVVSPGAHHAYAYDPKTGKELWHIEYGDGFSNVPAPVFAHGLVYICSGFFQPVIFAVRPDGRGNVTKSHVAWSYPRAVPLTPSPVVAGDELYMVSDNGIATCLDAKTGKVHWQRRIGGNHSASPVYADGRVHFLSEEGECTVLAAGSTEYRELAKNNIGERTLASLAVAGRSFFLRGDRTLYRISK